jgi:hypothetical protein
MLHPESKLDKKVSQLSMSEYTSMGGGLKLKGLAGKK